MAKKGTFNWGIASLVGGAGVFLYLGYREAVATKIATPGMIPDAISPSPSNVSRTDPSHFTYRLRDKRDNPSYNLANYTSDLIELGKSIGGQFVPTGYSLCDVFGPFNDLQSPYGARAGYVIEASREIGPDEYLAKAKPFDRDLSGLNTFVERLWIPVWSVHPTDSRFGSIVDALISPVTDGFILETARTRVAYQPKTWIGKGYIAVSDSKVPLCSADDVGLDPLQLPGAIKMLQKYDALKDARDDL